MQRDMASIVGRRIKGVVVKERRREPHSQVFLIFDDGTYYEFYSSSMINGTSDVSEGGVEQVRSYMPEHTMILEYLEEKDLHQGEPV